MNYKIHCIIGVNDNERNTTQTLLMDLSVSAQLIDAAIHDCFKKTIDYQKLGEFCQQQALKKNYFLIESLAFDTLENLFTSFPIDWAKITLKKPSALKDAEYAAVEYEKTRISNRWS